MPPISIEEAESNLSELVRELQPGDEVILTDNGRPVARLGWAKGERPKQPRQPGTLRGTVTYMAPDFDEPLDDFRESMQ